MSTIDQLNADSDTSSQATVVAKGCPCDSEQNVDTTYSRSSRPVMSLVSQAPVIALYSMLRDGSARRNFDEILRTGAKIKCSDNVAKFGVALHAWLQQYAQDVLPTSGDTIWKAVDSTYSKHRFLTDADSTTPLIRAGRGAVEIVAVNEMARCLRDDTHEPDAHLRRRCDRSFRASYLRSVIGNGPLRQHDGLRALLAMGRDLLRSADVALDDAIHDARMICALVVLDYDASIILAADTSLTPEWFQLGLIYSSACRYLQSVSNEIRRLGISSNFKSALPFFHLAIVCFNGGLSIEDWDYGPSEEEWRLCANQANWRHYTACVVVANRIENQSRQMVAGNGARCLPFR